MNVTGNISKAKGLASDLTQEQIAEIANQLRTFFASEEFRQLWSEDTFYKNTAIWKSVLEKLNKKVDAEDGKGLSSNDFTKYEQEALAGAIQAIESVGKALDGYQKKLTFDSTPTSGSKNPVTSAGIERALAKKADIVDLNSYQTKLTFDETPTDGSSNPVTSGGIKKELDKKVKAEDGKGLSTNDFTNAEKTLIANLKGAYVFMGSLVDMPYNLRYPGDLPKGITPVYNYIGEDIEFTQPDANGTPYQVKSLGVVYRQFEQDGAEHACFLVSQNESVIFYKGLDVNATIGDDEENVLGSSTFTVVDVLPYDLNGEWVACVVLDLMSLPANVLWVQCSPVVKIRKGDNIAAFEIAGRVFWEVFSHDYGKEIKELSDKIGTGGGIAVDDILSEESENPVQNKVVTQIFNRIIEKLNGAYVFIGTYYELSKLPYYTSDLEEGITPVFNYQGEKIEFIQPYSGVPYLITVKDSGMTGCEDSITRAYFTVPQNEGILFKQGMILQMHLKNGENYLVPIHSIHCTLLDPDDFLGENVVKIVLEQTEMFSSDISTVACQPTVTFRTGDNIAIIKVAGNVFYEVLSHDYGEEIEALQDEHRYLNNQIGEIEEALQEIKALQSQYIGGAD